MENRYWRYTAWIAVIIFIVYFSYGAGYTAGFTKGVTWAVHTGLQFTEIDIDEEVLLDGLFQYKNNIEGCMFIED